MNRDTMLNLTAGDRVRIPTLDQPYEKREPWEVVFQFSEAPGGPAAGVTLRREAGEGGDGSCDVECLNMSFEELEEDGAVLVAEALTVL